ncbi:MAG: hypothetical protein BWX97_00529 [Firmicutes bacterium ADurb.Bin146]|jgi:hypothetical protein|nr:MAG: hypothetical protein BWX97_00529 [Firmicutes bacterium ADurb.Bin146]
MQITKKIIILSVMLVLLLTSCNRNNYSPEPSYNDTGINYNDFMPITGTYALTEQGAYTVVENRVYYLNDENKWNLLCFDPACKHKSSACSAYISRVSEIFTYDNYIYYFSGYKDNAITLSRMNLMGKEREDVKKIIIENSTSSANYAYTIKANNLMIRFRSIDREKDYVSTTLYTTDLDKSTDVKVVATGDVDEFIMTKYWLFYTEKLNGIYSLKGYSFETGEYITIFSDFTEPSKYISTIYTPDPDTFYWFQADKGFMKMNKEDMNHVVIKKTDPSYERGGATYGSEYIYIFNYVSITDKNLGIPEEKRGLFIYNHQGEIIDFIGITSLGVDITGYTFETDDKVYFREISGSSTPNLYCISKEDIGSGNLVWSLVEMDID